MSDAHVLDPLIRRLDSHCRLDDDDRDAIRSLTTHRRDADAGAHIALEGEPAIHCPVLISGFACRQKVTREGRRQIVGLQVPGEPLDFQSLFLKRIDHNVQALSRCELALVPRAELRKLVTTRATIAAAVMAYNMVEASILREWLLNVGQRDARMALAHLLVEFAYRVDVQGRATPGNCVLPMTQEQISDALGLTSVHVNRSLKALEAEGLIRRTGRNITFPSPEALRAVGDFDPRYLHRDN